MVISRVTVHWRQKCLRTFQVRRWTQRWVSRRNVRWHGCGQQIKSKLLEDFTLTCELESFKASVRTEFYLKYSWTSIQTAKPWNQILSSVSDSAPWFWKKGLYAWSWKPILFPDSSFSVLSSAPEKLTHLFANSGKTQNIVGKSLKRKTDKQTNKHQWNLNYPGMDSSFPSH